MSEKNDTHHGTLRLRRCQEAKVAGDGLVMASLRRERMKALLEQWQTPFDSGPRTCA